LVEEHKEKRSPGKPMQRWENNTKMDLRDIGVEDVD
jgi:hypothetical protein